MAQFVDSVILTDGAENVFAEDGRLLVRPKSRFAAAVERGDAYNWACVTANWAAGDTLIGLENNELARSLYIYRILLSTATTTSYVVFGTSGVTVAGTNAITGVNLNRRANRVARATCIDAETGQDQAGSSWPLRFYSNYMLAGQNVDLMPDGAIVIPPDGFIGVDYIADTAGGNVSIWGWFE
jgi:hypothetical protein